MLATWMILCGNSLSLLCVACANYKLLLIIIPCILFILHKRDYYIAKATYLAYATSVVRICSIFRICNTCISHMRHISHMQHLYFAYATYVAYATCVLRICNIFRICNTFSQKVIFFQKVPDEIFFNVSILIPAREDCTKLKKNLQLSKKRPGGSQDIKGWDLDRI